MNLTIQSEFIRFESEFIIFLETSIITIDESVPKFCYVFYFRENELR